MRLRVDAITSATKKMIGITIGNGIYCAGGMQLTPNALTDDGQLDLLGIHEMNFMTRFLNFGKVYSGNHVNSKYFSLTRAKEIYLDSGPSVWIEADGELLGKTPCRIGIVPGAIRVRYR
jgi:diacylglycerol kinase (ATP)